MLLDPAIDNYFYLYLIKILITNLNLLLPSYQIIKLL